MLISKHPTPEHWLMHLVNIIHASGNLADLFEMFLPYCYLPRTINTPQSFNDQYSELHMLRLKTLDITLKPYAIGEVK